MEFLIPLLIFWVVSSLMRAGLQKKGSEEENAEQPKEEMPRPPRPEMPRSPRQRPERAPSSRQRELEKRRGSGQDKAEKADRKKWSDPYLEKLERQKKESKERTKQTKMPKRAEPVRQKSSVSKRVKPAQRVMKDLKRKDGAAAAVLFKEIMGPPRAVSPLKAGRK